MNKFVFVLLAASVGLNLYLVNVEVVVKDEFDQEYVPIPPADKISIAQSAIKKEIKPEECQPKVVEKIVYKESEMKECPASPAQDGSLGNFSEEEMKEMTAKHQEAWKKQSKTFFEYELGLTPTQVEDYEKLKTNMEKEVSSFISDKLRDLPAGTMGFTPSPEEMVEIGKINQKYTQKLKHIFGETAYREYLSFKEAYNQELRSQNKGLFGVQF